MWKLGDEVFAIGGWADGEPAFTFKTSDISYEMLKQQPGLRPAPISRLAACKWIQHFAEPGLSDQELKDHIRQSHRIVASGLTKKKLRELGLAEP